MPSSPYRHSFTWTKSRLFVEVEPAQGFPRPLYPESTFWLDSNSKPHLLRVSAARKRGSIGRAFIFSLLAELVSAIPCSS